MSANCTFTISNEINNNEEETGGQTYTSGSGSDDYFHFQDGDDIKWLWIYSDLGSLPRIFFKDFHFGCLTSFSPIFQ